MSGSEFVGGTETPWGRHLRRQSEGGGCLRCGVWYEKAPEEERDVGLTGKGHEGADRRM